MAKNRKTVRTVSCAGCHCRSAALPGGDVYLRDRVAALREAIERIIAGEPAACVQRTLDRELDAIESREWRNKKRKYIRPGAAAPLTKAQSHEW